VTTGSVTLTAVLVTVGSSVTAVSSVTTGLVTVVSVMVGLLLTAGSSVMTGSVTLTVVSVTVGSLVMTGLEAQQYGSTEVIGSERTV